MQTLLLLRAEPPADGADHREGFGTEADWQVWQDFDRSARDAGVLVASGELTPPTGDYRVVPDLAAGQPATPPDTSWPVIGFYLLEVPDADAAREWAVRMPLYGEVEIRPLVTW